MKVYFMRHGQTNFNCLGLCNDNPSIDVHLSATGKQQAQLVARALKSKNIQRVIAHDPLHIRVNNGESLLDHKTRVIAFLYWLQQQPESTLLVVAHEETLRVIAAYFQQLDDETMIQLAFDNCEYLNFTF